MLEPLGDERDPHAPPELALVLPPEGGVETPQNHVMVCVMSRFPDGNILDQTAVCSENLVRT